MTAFASAIDALFADPNLAREAVYIAEGGAPVPVRIMPRREDQLTSFGEARIVSDGTRFDLRNSEIADPRPGDRIEMAGDAFIVQGEPVRDPERLVWTLDTRPA